MMKHEGGGARRLAAALASVALLGCGDGGAEGGDADASGGGTATCTTTAAIEVSQDPGVKTLTATGAITCAGGTADLALEVCAQLDGSDVICATRSQSGAAQLSEIARTSCLGEKVFRARVVGTVDGVDTEVFSSAQTVQCM